MADSIHDFELFALYPANRKATNILLYNQELGLADRFRDHLIFYAKQTSRHRQGIASFGLNMANDVVYKVHTNKHLCTFTLTCHGDLMLHDASHINRSPMTALTVLRDTDGGGGDDSRRGRRAQGYCMTMEREMGGRAQQRRVIPMSGAFPLVRVEIGRGVHFDFRWRVPLDDPASVARTRSALAAIYSGHPQQYDVARETLPRDTLPRQLLPADSLPPHPPPPPPPPSLLLLQQQLPVTEQPAPSPSPPPPPAMHIYGGVRPHMPGRVREAVDLEDGCVFAVKSLAGPAMSDDDGGDGGGARREWKQLAKLKALSLDTLNHKNIAKVMYIDGLAADSLSQPLDFYYQRYAGNARDYFLDSTSSSSPDAAAGAFAGRQQRNLRVRCGLLAELARQMLQALAYLDRQGVFHGNVKPENILHRPDLFTGATGFFLADFAFGGAEEHVGTVGYMAPETARYYTRSAKSDLYALGVTVLELMGVLAVREFALGIRHWRARLAGWMATTTTAAAAAAATGGGGGGRGGGPGPGPGPVVVVEMDGMDEMDDESHRFGHRQVQALYLNGLLSPAMRGLVVLQSGKRHDAHGAMEAFRELGENAFRFGRDLQQSQPFGQQSGPGS